MMKKSVVALIISLIFLVGCMVLVLIKNKPVKSIEMDRDYIVSNYEIELTDKMIEKSIELTGEATYKGEDKITEAPVITLDVSCFYNYIDNDEEFTDLLNERMELKLDGNKYVGKVMFPLLANEVKEYSCSYTIESTTGSYQNNK